MTRSARLELARRTLATALHSDLQRLGRGTLAGAYGDALEELVALVAEIAAGSIDRDRELVRAQDAVLAMRARARR